MTKQINPFEPLIKEYFSKLNLIYGYLFQMGIRLERHKQNLQKIYEDNHYSFEQLFAGTTIPFSDLSEWPDDNFRKWYPSGIFSTTGKQYLEFSEHLIQREAALSIGFGYEALGFFLKNICSKSLCLNHNLADPKKLILFEEYLKKNQKKKIDDYWYEYIKYSFNNTNYKGFLKFLRSISPEYKRLETENNRNLNLADWVEVTATVRHSVIHSSSRIKKIPYERLTKAKKELLFMYYPGEQNASDYLIESDEENAKKQFEILCEYGFLVYKCLSIEFEYEWNIFGFK